MGLFALFVVSSLVLFFSAALLLMRPDPNVDVSLYEDTELPTQLRQVNFSIDDPDSFVSYSYTRTSKGVLVERRMPLLARVEAGGPVGVYPHDFVVPDPLFSVKILNPTSHPLLVSELTVDVVEAKLDTEPILFLGENIEEGGRVAFQNAGWGKVINPVLHISFTNLASPPDSWPNKYDFTESGQTFEDSYEFHTPKAGSEKHQAMIGLLEYTTENGQRKSLKLFEKTQQRHYGGNTLPLAEFDFELNPERTGKLFRSVAFQVAPNSADHALIRLHSTKSGFFTLLFEVHFVDGNSVQSSKTAIHTFSARILNGLEPKPTTRGILDGRAAENLKIVEQAAALSETNATSALD